MPSATLAQLEHLRQPLQQQLERNQQFDVHQLEREQLQLDQRVLQLLERIQLELRQLKRVQLQPKLTPCCLGPAYDTTRACS